MSSPPPDHQLRDLLYPGLRAYSNDQNKFEDIRGLRVDRGGAFLDMNDGQSHQILTRADIDDGSFKEKFKPNVIGALYKDQR